VRPECESKYSVRVVSRLDAVALLEVIHGRSTVASALAAAGCWSCW
jgi:hypothetical protein